MVDNKVLTLVYTFFLGIFIALFVGVGINTFYPGPKAPEFPVELNTYGKELNAEQVAKQQQWDKTMAEFNKKEQPYNRNVSMITLGASVLILALSVMFERHIKVLADGVMLGGLLTLVYSFGRGFASQDSKYQFVVTTVGLIIVMYLGYHRFVRSRTPVVSTTKA